MSIVERPAGRRLSFRFPDPGVALASAGVTSLAGPVSIAITNSAAAMDVVPLPCGLAAGPCSAQSGLIACVDDLYARDGSCQPNLDATFPHFTALPIPNDYAAACVKDEPPCVPEMDSETRYKALRKYLRLVIKHSIYYACRGKSQRRWSAPERRFDMRGGSWRCRQ